MSDNVRQKLAWLVGNYGPEVAADVRRCKGLLLDLCGEARREINVLVAAAEENVTADLVAGGGVPPEVLVGRAIRKLIDNRGIAEGLARWAVESWALALGVAAPASETPRSGQPKASPPIPLAPKPSQVPVATEGAIILPPNRLRAGPARPQPARASVEAIGSQSNAAETIRIIPLIEILAGLPNYETGRPFSEDQMQSRAVTLRRAEAVARRLLLDATK